MIRPTIRNKAYLALAVLLVLALMNMALGHHMLGKMRAVSQTVVDSSDLYRLTKRVLSTVTHPRASDPQVNVSLFEALDAEVSEWSVSEQPIAGLAADDSQLQVFWADMARDWQRLRVGYDAMRRGGDAATPQRLAEIDTLASDLAASIGAVQFLAARELEAVYKRLKYVAIVLGVVDVVVIALLLAGLGSHVLSPLSRLARTAREYSAEDYEHQFASKESHEIGDLSRALDRSAARVRSLLASVRNNAELRAQAEEKFRGLVEHAGVGVFLLQGERYLYVNSCLADLLALPVAKIYSESLVGDQICDADSEHVGELLQACLRGERRTIHYECRIRRGDGSLLHCEVFGTRTEYAGSPAIIGTVIDHTERRRADAQLRKLSSAIEQSRATVVVTDAEGVIEYVNPHFTELTGFTAEEAVGLTPSVVRSGLTPQQLYDDLWKSLREGREWSGEILNRKKSGELFWEHMTASAVRDGDGEITHFVAVKEDITARKRADQELERLNRTLKVLSEFNQTLVQSTTETELQDAICRNLVDVGGYRMAFVGAPVDSASCEVTVLAHCGSDAGYLADVGDADRGLGLTGSAIRSGETLVVRDIESDPAYVDLGAAALACGFRSTIALPLSSDEQTLGALRIYAGEVNAFSEDEVKLLRELAADLAYGMMSLRTREQRQQAESALRESEQRFRSISASALDAIVMLDADGQISYWNPAAERISGYASDEVVGKPALPRLIAPRDLGQVKTALAEIAGDGGESYVGQTIELRGRRRDGSMVDIEASTSAVMLDGRWQLVVMARDVSARKRAEEALNIRNRAIESSSNAIIIAKADKREDNPIIYVNPAFERITGYSRAEVKGRNPRFLLGQDWDQSGIDRLRDAMRRHVAAQVLLRNYRKDQSEFAAEISVSPVMDETGRLSHYISVITDITERMRFETEMRHRATHDQLTGLPNRVLLSDRIEQAVAHAGRSGRHVAVLLLDLDRFKVINDSLGHGAGDAVVRAVAERLTTCVRRGDTVARIGGDEFAVVLEELADAADASHVAQKIHDALGFPVDLPDQPVFVTTSIGISLAPADGTLAETLLRNADVAMYASKDQGGNCVRFYLEGMNERARQQLSLEADLRKAVEREEFELHYQPKLDVRSGRVIGAEALIRWRHPERGMISPMEFIPMAEDTGMIVPIGAWALREACRCARSWHVGGEPPIGVAVNISARQFRDGSLATVVADVLSESGLPPPCLELELTESMIMQNADATIAALEDLKAIGVMLSIDDFGTGYSSLSYLRSFPVDTLKIDRSFVKDLTDSADSQTIAGTIIVLASGLGMGVIAEGVETIEQLAFLRERECHQIQGYLFSRPLPEAEFRALHEQSLRGDLPLLGQLRAVRTALASAG